MKIHSPTNYDASQYYTRYLALITGEDLLAALQNISEETFNVTSTLKDKDLSFAYAQGKWNIGVLLQHICDAERVYAYRALRFLRRDESNLPGFDENNFAEESVGYTSIADFKLEYEAIRANTIQLFKNSYQENLDFEGTANGIKFSPRVLGWLAVGHNIHHLNVLQERYLLNL